MEMISRYTPVAFVIGIALSLVGTAFGVLARLLDPSAVDETIYGLFTAVLARWFTAIAVIIGGVVLLFTTVQLAVVDLHSDPEKKLQEEKSRMRRLVLMLFLLVVFWASGQVLPYSAQNLEYGHSILSEYFLFPLAISIVFFLCGCVLWHESHKRGWI